MRPSLRSADRRLRRGVRRLVDPRTSSPSFTYKDAEMRRLRQAQRALGADEDVWSVNDKDAARAWAERAGLPQPRLLAHCPAAAAIDWSALPDRVVVKPSHGADSRGVHLLVREGSGWRELASGRRTTAEDVVAHLTDLADRGVVSSSLVLEELVEDPRRPGLPPVDWKVLTFFGQVGLVVGKAHGFDADGAPRTSWRFFDDQLRDVGAAFSGHAIDEGVLPPRSGLELVRLAARISASVPRPFLRVDLYDGPDGPVFGEITPQPGWRMTVRRDVDLALGRMWEDAQARVALRASAFGALAPGLDPLEQAAGLLAA